MNTKCGPSVALDQKLNACGSIPGGGGVFLNPFFGPLVDSLRILYFKRCNHKLLVDHTNTLSTSEVFSSYVFSLLNHSVILKSNLKTS